MNKRRGMAAKMVMCAIIIGLAMPALALAAPQRGRDRKAERFINGHDARDGRWDGRGPRGRKRQRQINRLDRFANRYDRQYNRDDRSDNRQRRRRKVRRFRFRRF